MSAMTAEQMVAPCECHACRADRALREAGVSNRLLSRERTAEVLSLSVDAVDELYYAGKLAAVMVGRRRLHSVQAIENFIGANELFYGEEPGV